MVKSSLFPLLAGGDEEYIYMNKVPIHKQQGDQEKQDKGRELKINSCLISNGAMKAHVVKSLALLGAAEAPPAALRDEVDGVEALPFSLHSFGNHGPCQHCEVIPGSSTLESVILG